MKKSVPISDYNNLLANYLKVCDDLNNPSGEIARLKNHIEFMEEEAKRLQESYNWVCQRLENIEKKRAG